MNLRCARLVPASVLALASLAGCYLHHGLSDSDDGGSTDAAVVDARPRDAALPPIDATLMCPITRADFTCLASSLVQPDHAFTLPLSFDTCACCARAECAVTVDATTQTLQLTSTLCPDPCDCATCNTPVAECAIPALTPGYWVVEVNGAPAYRLPIMYDSGLVPPPPACADFAEPDPCTGAATLDGHPQPASSTCVQRAPGGDRYWVEVTNSCGGCDHESICEAMLQPRLTADLPPGGDLYVAPTRFNDACGTGCPEWCIEQTRRCEVPPLVAGQYYRVFIDGILRVSFTAGTDATVCGGGRGG